MKTSFIFGLFSGAQSKKRYLGFKAMQQKLMIFFLLILCGIVASIHAEGFLRLYLGPVVQYKPGEKKVTGLGEIHVGYESEIVYVAFSAGVSSKKLLSFKELKNQYVINTLDGIVQSDFEFYLGAVFDSVLWHIDELPITTRYPSPDGPTVNPGYGINVRAEIVLNLLAGNSNKDPNIFSEFGIYPYFYWATKFFTLRPMIGIGFNNRLDYHFIDKESPSMDRDRIWRWKLRVDLSTRELIKLGKASFLFFLLFQHEWPSKKMSSLLLGDGTIGDASPLPETSVRVGIMIDLLGKKKADKKGNE